MEVVLGRGMTPLLPAKGDSKATQQYPAPHAIRCALWHRLPTLTPFAAAHQARTAHGIRLAVALPGPETRTQRATGSQDVKALGD